MGNSHKLRALKKIIACFLIIIAIGFVGMTLSIKLFGVEGDISWFSLLFPMLCVYQAVVYLGEKEIVPVVPLTQKNRAVDEGLPFDPVKRKAFINKLEHKNNEWLVPIEEFFDGNNDESSIGCNLWPEHPGIDVFRTVFQRLQQREDVGMIYSCIKEVEPDEESWPYADTIYVVGSISIADLTHETQSIQPTEVGAGGDFFTSIPRLLKCESPKFVRVLW